MKKPRTAVTDITSEKIELARSNLSSWQPSRRPTAASALDALSSEINNMLTLGATNKDVLSQLDATGFRVSASAFRIWKKAQESS